MKYRIRVNAIAYMTQVIEVEANSVEEAEDKVSLEEMWHDGIWEYEGLSEAHTPEVDYVEVIE